MNKFFQNLMIACAVGAIGGLAKPALSQSQYFIPMFSNHVFHPGFLGGILLGFVAGGLYWLLYGPPVDPAPTSQDYGKHLAAALVVGMSGSGWLGSETEKNMYKQTAVLASHNDPTLLPIVQNGTPSQAFQKALSLNPASSTSGAVAPSVEISPRLTSQ